MPLLNDRVHKQKVLLRLVLLIYLQGCNDSFLRVLTSNSCTEIKKSFHLINCIPPGPQGTLELLSPSLK